MERRKDGWKEERKDGGMDGLMDGGNDGRKGVGKDGRRKEGQDGCSVIRGLLSVGCDGSGSNGAAPIVISWT